ncbi:unnamed protein product [Allacma fusca]|uniref:UBA domain-containing protein n=1 Tax=Allacma fusca TaxID=39272 RepID=A0A8J2PG80_9HEXA|nr:unnamed protein product [Allacma fusca]
MVTFEFDGNDSSVSGLSGRLEVEGPNYENTRPGDVSLKRAINQRESQSSSSSNNSSGQMDGGVGGSNLALASTTKKIVCSSSMLPDSSFGDESTSYENLNMDYISRLTGEGFSQELVIRALGITRNDIDMARDILHEFGTRTTTLSTTPTPTCSSSSSAAASSKAKKAPTMS